MDIHTNQYDAFEIHPCVLLDIHGKPVSRDDPGGMYYEQCDESDPDIAVWSLYGHLPEGGLDHIRDYNTRDEAKNALQELQVYQEGLSTKKG